MKRLTILVSVLVAATLLTSPALAQQQPGGQMRAPSRGSPRASPRRWGRE